MISWSFAFSLFNSLCLILHSLSFCSFCLCFRVFLLNAPLGCTLKTGLVQLSVQSSATWSTSKTEYLLYQSGLISSSILSFETSGLFRCVGAERYWPTLPARCRFPDICPFSLGKNQPCDPSSCSENKPH